MAYTKDTIYLEIIHTYPDGVEFAVIIPNKIEVKLNKVYYTDIKVFINVIDNNIKNELIWSYGDFQSDVIVIYYKDIKQIRFRSDGIFCLNLDTETSYLFVEKLRMILDNKLSKIS